jgi:MraZ protein
VKEWRLIEEKIAALPQFKPEVKALQRIFVSGATECPLDKQGRIVLPASLRDYAELKKEIVFVGMTKRVEIWSKENWNKAVAASQAALESTSGGLADLGL